MTTFQSYVIYGNQKKKIREKTISIAKSLGIKLEKASPDFFRISPIKNAVTIDQIRELKSHIFQKPLKSEFKFIIIESADQLTQEAQSALLKIFEEPPKAAIIVLESQSKETLLPTIISRAVLIKAQPDAQMSPDLIIDQDLNSALAKIAEIADPKSFLDEQIIALTEKLVRDTSMVGSDSPEGRKVSLSVLVEAVEKYKEAKQMIAANVNPTFVLATLLLSTSRQV